MQTMECNAFLRSGVTTLLFEKRDGWEATDQSVARVLANIWSTAVAVAKSWDAPHPAAVAMLTRAMRMLFVWCCR